MIESSNFGIAVITVILRGLLDRILSSFHIPSPAGSTLVIKSTTLAVLSGTLILIYKYLQGGRRFPICFLDPHVKRRPKILDGNLHKTDSQFSSVYVRKERPRKYRARRGRNRENLLHLYKNTVQELNDNSSVQTMSSKCSEGHAETPLNTETCPSVCSSNESVGENLEKLPESRYQEESNGYGDCKQGEKKVGPQLTRRRKRMKINTRKTRSGKIYSSYMF